jgi:hypothetical protein
LKLKEKEMKRKKEKNLKIRQRKKGKDWRELDLLSKRSSILSFFMMVPVDRGSPRCSFWKEKEREGIFEQRIFEACLIRSSCWFLFWSPVQSLLLTWLPLLWFEGPLSTAGILISGSPYKINNLKTQK